MALPLINFGDLPAEGRTYSGEHRTDIFGLTGPIDPIFVPPLRYEVTVRREEGDIVVAGTVEARFALPCSRCPARLPWQVTMDPYFTCEAPEGDTLDLTAQLREDILLTLPAYPRCEESNVEPQPCQTEGAFAPESEFTPLTGEEPSDAPRPDPWQALDRLSPGRPPSDS